MDLKSFQEVGKPCSADPRVGKRRHNGSLFTEVASGPCRGSPSRPLVPRGRGLDGCVLVPRPPADTAWPGQLVEPRYALGTWGAASPQSQSPRCGLRARPPEPACTEDLDLERDLVA